MSRFVIAVVAAFAVAVACVHATNPLGPYKVSTVTVGGLSAGAFMAVQYHFAWGSELSGASVFAGGPYYCAQASIDTALINCMNPNMVEKPPATKYLIGLADVFAAEGKIDGLGNLTNQKVFLYSGLLDTVVHRPVMDALQDMYNDLIKPADGGNVTTSFDVLSEHCYPTVDYGEACTTLGSPYIGKCDYDGAGYALKTLYGELKPKTTPVSANLMSWSQSEFITDPSSVSLGPTGYIYVPTACQQGAECSLHIEFHGCQQDIASIQEEFVEDIGLNNWAESNNIIVLYPQVQTTLISNPDACWDWWGYTGKNYAFKTGPQMAFVHKVQAAVTGQA